MQVSSDHDLVKHMPLILPKTYRPEKPPRRISVLSSKADASQSFQDMSLKCPYVHNGLHKRDCKDHAKLPLPIPGSRCSSGHSYQETSLPTQTHIPTQAEVQLLQECPGWQLGNLPGSEQFHSCSVLENKPADLASWTSLPKVHSSSCLGHVHLSLCASVLQLSRGDDNIN